MIDEAKETIWEIVLACLIGAFFGMIVAQFIPNRDNVMMIIFIGMIIVLSILTIYYFIEWRIEVCKEKKKGRLNKRSGYSR